MLKKILFFAILTQLSVRLFGMYNSAVADLAHLESQLVEITQNKRELAKTIKKIKADKILRKLGTMQIAV
jgi:hypothetical protein